MKSFTENKKSDKWEKGRAHQQNFFLAFIDELQKPLFIEKTAEVGQ